MKNKILLIITAALLIVTIYQASVISNMRNYELTENDMYRIKDIYLGNTVTTDLDYKIYDLNGDGAIDGFDMMVIKRLLNS